MTTQTLACVYLITSQLLVFYCTLTSLLTRLVLVRLDMQFFPSSTSKCHISWTLVSTWTWTIFALVLELRFLAFIYIPLSLYV